MLDGRFADALYVARRVDRRVFWKIANRLREIEATGDGSVHIELHLHAKGVKSKKGPGLVLRCKAVVPEEYDMPEIVEDAPTDVDLLNAAFKKK